MINNIKTLLSSDLLSNYKISKETGIAQSTLSDFTNGKIEIENMRLKYALLLNKVYEKYRGEIEVFDEAYEDKSRLTAIQSKIFALHNHYKDIENDQKVVEAWDELLKLIENETKIRQNALNELHDIISKM